MNVFDLVVTAAATTASRFNCFIFASDLIAKSRPVVFPLRLHPAVVPKT
jgi:hypothetical protein